MNNLKEFKCKNVDLSKMNNSYFYERLYFSLKEDEIDINYGDFCSRIMKNGISPVLKSLGIYAVKGARDTKKIYVHEKLELIINTTISDNEIISKTIIDLCEGKYVNIGKFVINDLSLFFSLNNDYPYSIDTSKCTYIIYNKNNKLSKIGRSLNVFNRLNRLRNEISKDLDLLAYINTDVEGLLHKEYLSKREYGEWFSLKNDDILDIKNKYNLNLVKLID